MFKLMGDARWGAYGFKTEQRDGTTVSRDTDLRVRIRAGVQAKFGQKWRGNIRFAGRYSDEQKGTNFTFRDNNATRTFGQSTFDMLNVQFIPGKKLKFTFGRFQTDAELQGVPKKSLSRLDSSNVDIGWTDGIYAVIGEKGKWQTHAVLQHNPEEGTTNITRSPLNFVDNDTRYSAYVNVEKKQKEGRFVQRGIDFTYLPEALLINKTTNQRDDYVAVVARGVLRFPVKSGGEIWLGGAVGHAPNTPPRSRVKLSGTGDADGNAYQMSINWMNFVPKHSIGFVYGRADAGWLISESFTPNEDLYEVRHKWQITKKFRLENRIRYREEVERQVGQADVRKRSDYYIRFTYKF